MSTENDDKAVQLMSLTGCDLDMAKSYIEMAGGDVNRAFELYNRFQQGGMSPNTQGGRAPVQPSRGEDDIPSPITQQRVSTLVYDGPTRPRIGAPRLVDGIMSGLSRGLGNAAREISTAVRNMQVRGQGGRGGRGGRPQQGVEPGMTEGSEVFRKLFAPPKEIMFRGTFDQCRDYAQKRQRWILVNIQSSNVFACLELNRDVWSNELIREFIKENFVFYQANIFEENGQKFQARYMKGIFSFPYIAVIDPITGMEEKKWIGKMKQEEMYNHLIEFIKNRNTIGDGEENLPSVDSVKPMFSHTSSGGGQGQGGGGFAPPSGPDLLQPRPSGRPGQDDPMLQIAMMESLRMSRQEPKEPPQKMIDEDEESEELIDDGPSLKKRESDEEDDDDDVEIGDDDELGQMTPDPVQVFEEEQKFPDEDVNLEVYTGKSIRGDKTRVQLILPNGKREVVTILKSAPLATIYAAFRSKLSDDKKKEKFSVVFFNRTLENTMERSLADDKIQNASLSLSFD